MGSHYSTASFVSQNHYNDVIMGAVASQFTSLTIVLSVVYLDTDERKHQSSAPLAFVRGIHRRPVKSPHKWPVTRKMFPFDDVIMILPGEQWVSFIGSKQINVLPCPLQGVSFMYGTLRYGTSKFKISDVIIKWYDPRGVLCHNVVSTNWLVLRYAVFNLRNNHNIRV